MATDTATGVDNCAICLDPVRAGDAKFTASCQHQFHVQCIERNVITATAGGNLNLSCPMCRAPWTWAPGVVAMNNNNANVIHANVFTTTIPAHHEPLPPPTTHNSFLGFLAPVGNFFGSILGFGGRRSTEPRPASPPLRPSPPPAGVFQQLHQQQLPMGYAQQNSRRLRPTISSRFAASERSGEAGAVHFPDVAPPGPLPTTASAAASPGAPAEPAAPPRLQLDSLADGWCTVSAMTDLVSVPRGAASAVTSLVKVAFADDDDANPFTTPTDFILLADVSGSMSGDKIQSVLETLLKVSDMFNRADRVSLVRFESLPTQLTPLAPLSVASHEGQFRQAAMEQMIAGGGTDIAAALMARPKLLPSALRVVEGSERHQPPVPKLALDILDARTVKNPLAHILLLSDGEDRGAYNSLDALIERSQRLAGGPASISSFGYGADHDAELLSTFAARGRGTFTFVENTGVLDETFAAFMGDATSVVAQDVVVTVTPLPGTTLHKVVGPGTLTGPIAGTGAFELALQHAAVAAVRSILVKCTVEVPPAGDLLAGRQPRHEAFTVTVSGSPAGAASAASRGVTATRTDTQPCTVSLAIVDEGHAAPAAADTLTDIQSAVNRETVAAAAATVATVVSMGRPLEEAERAVAEAEQQLVGDTSSAADRTGAQAGYLRELQQLRSRMATDSSPAHALAVGQTLQMQRTIDTSRLSAPAVKMSKNATMKHSEMMVKKSRGGGSSSTCPTTY